MKNIIYIPLDERPCNYLYPKYMCNVREDINLIIPPINLLGEKKKSANIEGLWNFIFKNVKKSDAIILSIEMLFYGGLLPSRIHYLTEEHKNKIFENIKQLKKLNNNIKIYVSNLIMRTPKYSSADEEPDYYEQFGLEIFKRAYLIDKKNRVGLNIEEEKELEYLQNKVPYKFIKDYEDRRKYNININLDILDLVENRIIDFLSIPQDDSSEFGYTAIDQNKVVCKIREKRLQNLVHMYPGADEVGASLLARALNDLLNKKIKIYPFYSSLFGEQIIPLYEDRPMYESLKSHIMVTNSILTKDWKEADLILAINSPGKIMQEASQQLEKDITYSSFRNLLFFVEKIKEFINNSKKVVISDSAFANGGELELIRLLDDNKILDKLISYKGWNTNCNTLGTTIAQGVIACCDNLKENAIKENLIYHILEDTFYQSLIRKYIVDNILPNMKLNYFSLENKTKEITKIIEEKLINIYKEEIRNSFKNINIEKIEVFSPWNRMFEIGINLKIKSIKN